MTLPQTYSRRKRLAEKTEDVFQYDVMSEKLKNQILFIIAEITDVYYKKTRKYPSDTYDWLVSYFRKELGVTTLPTAISRDAKQEFEKWFRDGCELEYALDVIELIELVIIKAIDAHGIERFNSGDYNWQLRSLREEINNRMMEDQFGYQLEDGQIIRVDSKFAHKEIVVPALAILSPTKYNSANQEFRDAHQFYRDKDFRKAIHQCGNAFESVLKVIADERDWDLDANKDTASKYLTKVFEEELIPKYLQSEFGGLASILKDGVATVRNKGGGHGEGKDATPIPEHIAAFQLHQTAAAILLLAEAHEA